MYFVWEFTDQVTSDMDFFFVFLFQKEVPVYSMWVPRYYLLLRLVAGWRATIPRPGSSPRLYYRESQ